MKKFIYTIIISIFLLYILIFPQDAVQAAALGLSLWHEKMLPTLLPFSILSYILIHSGVLDGFARAMHRLLKPIFPISSAGVFPLTAGMLFGFPMGSKITAELVSAGKMTREEGERLYCICNNISPMFISSFILNDCLERPDLRLPTYLILYAPPLALYMLQNRRRHFASPLEATQKKPTSMSFQIIDAGIMNGFETLAKLGGYIVMFAILAQMTMLLPIKAPLAHCLFLGFTEITNGIAYTAKQSLDFQAAYPMILAFTAFGGLSGLAQTSSMIKETGFPLSRYFQTKLLATLLSFALAVLYVSH